ncbi:ABC transporter substrate-binding protein [Treponema sp. R6D11]
MNKENRRIFTTNLTNTTNLFSEILSPFVLVLRTVGHLKVTLLYYKRRLLLVLRSAALMIHTALPCVRLAGSWLMILLLFLGCTANKGREITDRTGKTVTIKNTINRVVSTAPSNTEIITDLGQAHKLVAIDRHSANVTGIPEGLTQLDFFYPDAEVIIKLSPDIIIASGHNPTGTGEDPFKLLRDAGIPVVYISMSASIDEIYNDIAFIADILRVEKEGEKLINSMKSQIDEIAKTSANTENKTTVYFEISVAPDMMTFGKGSYIDDMISVIGAKNVFGDENWLVTPGAEAIISRNPDVIFTNVNYIDDPIGEIKVRPGFNHINAVKNNRIYQIDTDSSVRPSSRIILALRQMKQAVYSLDH